MAAAIRQAGTASFKLDGIPYNLHGTLTVQPFSTQAEMIPGLSGIVGYKEMPIVPYMEAEIAPGGISVKALQGVRDNTVTAELANGAVYALRGAIFAGETSIDAAEGKLKVRFEGLECVEI